jgi:hypothetical protein
MGHRFPLIERENRRTRALEKTAEIDLRRREVRLDLDRRDQGVDCRGTVSELVVVLGAIEQRDEEERIVGIDLDPDLVELPCKLPVPRRREFGCRIDEFAERESARCDPLREARKRLSVMSIPSWRGSRPRGAGPYANA